MARDPIVFAMANPWPEIMPADAAEVRDDLIMGTGRSDFPNQINNVLGFPFIFRGALDTRASNINIEMKVAATKALAALAKENVPEAVSRAYAGERFQYGRDYLIPKPFDPRVLVWESHAVARAAIESGVARRDGRPRRVPRGSSPKRGSIRSARSCCSRPRRRACTGRRWCSRSR